MKNCANCRHWYQTVADRATAATNGQCRALPPITSYNWPRTRGDDFCSSHSANIQFATSEGPASQAPDRKARDLDNQAALPLEAPATRSKAGPRLRQKL